MGKGAVLRVEAAHSLGVDPENLSLPLGICVFGGLMV
jgi:hypothetical protein